MAATLEELERRVKVLESEVAGEAKLTRRAFEHVQEIRDDIGILRKHSAAVGDKLDEVLTRLGRLEGQFAGLGGQFLGLREALPAIVGDALREDRAALRQELRDVVRLEVRDAIRAELRDALRDALKGEGKA
jgi:hypothetical protein